MLTVIARLPIREGQMDTALAAFKTLIENVKTEEGTTLYALNKDPQNPNQLVVVEQYKDKAALDAHSATAHFKAFSAAAAQFAAGRPDVSILQQIDSI